MKSPTSCEAIVQEEKLCKITLGDRVVAADPCYDEGVWCAEFDIEMKPGTYDVRTVRGEVKEPTRTTKAKRSPTTGGLEPLV